MERAAQPGILPELIQHRHKSRTLGSDFYFLHYLPALGVQEISIDINFSDLKQVVIHL